MPHPREGIPFGHQKYVRAKTVGSFLPTVTARAFSKYGFSALNLVTDWPAVVGEEFAAVTTPERLLWPRRDRRTDADVGCHRRTGATLVLRVTPAQALEIQYATRQLIERINAYFGYCAVATLRIVQACDVAPASTAEAKRPVEPLAGEIVGFGDVRLREALAKLAGQVRASRSQF
jgi:hypothetical protein